jgi:hypothetical protein
MAVSDGAWAAIVCWCSARSVHPFMRVAPRVPGCGDWRPTASQIAAGQSQRLAALRGAVGRHNFARDSVA